MLNLSKATVLQKNTVLEVLQKHTSPSSNWAQENEEVTNDENDENNASYSLVVD